MRKPKIPKGKKIALYQTFSDLAYERDPLKVQVGLGQTNSGYKYDPKLSTREQKVFYNPVTRRAVMAFRGTDPHDKKTIVKDFISDAAIFTGTQRFNKRFRKSDDEFQKLKTKYAGYDVDVTGHSLGGALADYVAKRNIGRIGSAYTYSRGTGPVDMFRNSSYKTFDISNRFDPISLSGRIGNKVHKNKQEVNKDFSLNPLKAHTVSSTYKPKDEDLFRYIPKKYEVAVR